MVVAGTFDCFHPGHQDFLRQAARLGRVYVIVARDENVRKLKKHAPQQSEQIRLKKVRQNPEVFHAQLGHPTDFFNLIKKLKPNCLALGFDQQTFTSQELQQKLKIKIVRLQPFAANKFKTSLLKPAVNNRVPIMACDIAALNLHFGWRKNKSGKLAN